MTGTVLGIIGGSGVYDLPGLTDMQWIGIESPFGAPSDAILFARYEGLALRFLPRHGRGHRVSPSEINYRANIDALKRAGATDLISVSAVGSLQADLTPGTFVLADQYIDRTLRQDRSFFGSGCVAHVPFGDPASARLAAHVAAAGRAVGIDTVAGGTLVVIEGPQFSTRAESEMFRQWGAHVVGMTALPEARLAREAELPYLTVAMVTDYDCWHPDHDQVDVAEVVRTLNANRDRAQALIRAVAAHLPRQMEDDPARHALDYAIMTAPDSRDPVLLARLDAVAGRVLGQS